MSVDRSVTGLGLVACKRGSPMIISDLNRLTAGICNAPKETVEMQS